MTIFSTLDYLLGNVPTESGKSQDAKAIAAARRTVTRLEKAAKEANGLTAKIEAQRKVKHAKDGLTMLIKQAIY